MLITAVSGGIFALGLLFARMSDHHKVLDFLVLQPLLADSSASGAFPFPLSIPDRGETASGLPLMSRSNVSQVSSGWDASLMVTLGTVVCINVIALNLAPRLFATPLFANIAWPEVRKGLTWQLVIGAAIFGAGWGVAGVCPGPGLVGLASGRLFFLVWGAACLAGFHAFFTYDKIAAAWQRSAQVVAGAKKTS